MKKHSWSDRVKNSVFNLFVSKSEVLSSTAIVLDREDITDSISEIAADFNYFYDLIPFIEAIPKSLYEISQAIISQEYQIVNKKSQEEIKTIPIQLQQLMDKPYNTMKYDEYVRLIIKDLLITGNIWGYRIKDEFGKVYIRRIDPRRIEYIKGEWYEDINGRKYLLEDKFLTHIKLFPDPDNTIMGKGIIAENLALFKRLVKAFNFDDSFVSNGCNPSGILWVKSATGAVGSKKLKEEMADKSRRPGEPFIIEGENASWLQTQLDPATTKVPEKIDSLSNKVMSAFGLPRYLRESIKESGQKYNNHALQQEHYIKNTIIPIAKKIQSFFNESAIYIYDANSEMKYNIAKEIYTDETLQKLFDNGTITPNEHRRFLNIPEDEENEAMNNHYIATGKVLIEDVAAGLNQPQLPAPDPEVEPDKPDEEPEKEPDAEDDKPAKKIDKSQARTKTWRDKFYMSLPQDNSWTYKELAEPINLQRIRQDFETINQKTRDKKSKEYAPKMLEYLTLQYTNIFKAMKKNELELSNLTGAKADADVKTYVNKLIKVKDEQMRITELSMPLFQSVGDATFSNTANILTVSVPFAMIDPGVAAKVNLLREKTVLVPETTRNEIEAIVRRGVENLSTPQEVAKDMWRHFVDENKNLPDRFTVSTVSGKRLEDRAITIARNEVARANRMFNAESIKQSGVVKSIQLVGLPDADGTCTPYFNQNYPFEMADELSSIHVNCRCTIVPGEIVLL